MGQPMSSSEQAKEHFLGQLNEAADSGRWMAATWKVADGKIVFQNVTTFDFPDGDFLPAVGQLALRCHEEMIERNKPSLPKVPLPPAFGSRMEGPFRIAREPTGDGESKQGPVSKPEQAEPGMGE